MEKKRALVVEDSLLMRRMLTDTLVGCGFEAECAPDGKVAMEMIRRQAPDVLVTDLNMPNLDGMGLISRLDDAGYDFPIIVLTSDRSMITQSEVIAMGVRAYFRKPFPPNKVAKKALQLTQLPHLASA